MKLFSYGTLQDKELLDLISNGEPYQLLGDAILKGYTALKVVGEEYPVLTESPSDFLTGIIIVSDSEKFWHRLDFFETNYEKMILTVSRDGEDFECFLYSEEIGQQRAGEKWSFDEWRKHHKKAFLLRSHNFMKYYGKDVKPIW